MMWKTGCRVEFCWGDTGENIATFGVREIINIKSIGNQDASTITLVRKFHGITVFRMAEKAAVGRGYTIQRHDGFLMRQIILPVTAGEIEYIRRQLWDEAASRIFVMISFKPNETGYQREFTICLPEDFKKKICPILKEARRTFNVLAGNIARRPLVICGLRDVKRMKHRLDNH